MAYFAPYIDAAGLHIPTYADILADLIAGFRNIYGQDVYLGTDSADYQMLSIFALKISDSMNALQLAYNARSPLTAVGADLDSIVKLNGIARKPASYSTANLTLTFSAATTLTAAMAQDTSGFLWALPLSVVASGPGTVNVTATCQTPGAIQAAPATITTRATPTAGWLAVTNAAAASPGLAVETDSLLRARQGLSVALPSRTLVAGTAAAIAALPGVTRSVIEENPTGAPDANGCPAHSITAVVEGGDPVAIATAIFQNKGIGCFTNGSTTETIIDPFTGQPSVIGFDVVTYVPIYVILNVHALQGYTSATTVAIRAAVNNYLNSLEIGETLTISGLYAAAMAVMPNISLPQFSIRTLFAGTAPGPGTSVDIPVVFNAVVQGILANVTVNLV